MVAWLDKRAGGTGAVLTQYALQDDRWARQAAAACLRSGANDGLPEPHYQTAVWGSLPAGLFVALALWFSPPAPAPLLPVGLFDATLQRLAERLGDLEVMDLVTPEEVASLGERLTEIAATLDAGSIELAFEALDRVQEDLKKLAESHVDELAAMRDAGLAAAAGSPAELAEAFQSIMADPAMAKVLQAAAERLSQSNLAKGLEALGGLDGLADLGALDPDALAALGGAFSEELAQKLAEMVQAGFLDRKALERALTKRATPRSLEDLKFRHAPDCESRSGGL